MNILKHSTKSKYPLIIGSLLIATSAVAAVITATPESAPKIFTSPTTTKTFVLDGSAQPKAEVSQLEWSRCLVGQTFTDGKCTGDATEFDTWEAALAAPTPQQAADGWRIPNIKELMLITDNTQAFPAINTEVFPFATVFKFSQTDDYRPLAAAPSSPYIWSSTPVVHKPYHYNSYAGGPKDDDEKGVAAENKKKRENINLTYALDLGVGVPEEVYRSGVAKGSYVNAEGGKPYAANDPDSVKKARYVLLVKDIPKA